MHCVHDTLPYLFTVNWFTVARFTVDRFTVARFMVNRFTPEVDGDGSR